MIDPHSGVPLHRQVADLIRARIAAGEWAPGSFLPRETDLAHEYAVGLDTLRKAYAALRSEGIIRGGGPGTRASVPPKIRKEHVQLAARSTLSIRMPTPAERADHDIAEGVPVAEVRYDGQTRIFPGDRYDFRP